MKIAKKNIDTQNPDEGYNSFILRTCYPVKDTYDFNANSASDVTSLNISNILFRLGIIDVIMFKSIIKSVVLPNWATLSTEDRKTLIQFLVYPPAEDLSLYYTVEELDRYTQELGSMTKTARINRWESARLKMIYGLTEAESLAFYTDTKPFKDDYIDANIPSLIMWLSNGAYPPLGIDYTANGFAQKTYYSASRRDICLDVLMYGLY